ncbi:MAG: DEAD/DEAH box helicase [Acidimicrobiales bacterium]
MLQPFAVADAVLGAYRRYVRTSFPLRDPALDVEREELVDRGLLWSEPYVALARPGTSGPPLDSLAGLLDSRTLSLPWGFETLYAHQEQAIRRLASGPGHTPAPTLVLSGTGSGKTESFLIPIVDACLRSDRRGVKAIVVYPMNALANDQLKRLRTLLADCPEVSFGRYTGDAPESDAGDRARPPRPADAPPNARWSRQAMRDEPPNILLTNYTQLEYLLLRGRDRELFRFGPPAFLVVDEIHLFSGVLGAEVACLLRRLRQHVGAGPSDLCPVGTSATAGTGELPRLLEFASRLFGLAFGPEAAIAETPVPPRPLGARFPRPPRVTTAALERAGTPGGLASLAESVLGLDARLPREPDALAEALGRVIDDVGTIGVVERALDAPGPLSTAAGALGMLAERASCPPEELANEAMALLLVGAAARQAGIGEAEPQPRFRPRVHQVVRSLAGLWRCTDPGCGSLLPPGTGACSCGALALPLASCRTCGEAYLSSPALGAKQVDDVRQLQAIEGRRSDPRVFLADSRQLQPIDSDEDGRIVEWRTLAVCRHCLAAHGDPGGINHARACPDPVSGPASLLASLDAVHCPSCGAQGAAGRPVLIPLSGSAAASVAVLTQVTSDELRARDGEAAGRLLVFADSRQDAAQQAGYADDQGAKSAVRQLLVDAASGGPLSIKEAVGVVQTAVTGERSTLRRWLIGESDRRFAEVSNPQFVPTEAEERMIRSQLEWEVTLEITERARRRFALESEGLLVVEFDTLETVAESVTRQWPDQPFNSSDHLAQVIAALADIARYRRIVDHWMLQRVPRDLVRNHNVRIGDRAVNATTGFSSKRYSDRRAQVDLRAWSLPRNVTQLTELFGRVLERPSLQANDIVETLVERLSGTGFLSSSTVEGRKRLMLDHRRLRLVRRREQTLYRCDRCGLVRPRLLTSVSGRPLCTNWRCSGQPRPWGPATERDFYRERYLQPPRRLIVREHSGQIESDERLALEERFNDRSEPTVDALACTQTLEVGVSLDDLNAVILRNFPPTPANYAQRVGRAGRRSKVALSLAHAGQGPHDSYFFDRPEEMIAGEVRAPAISLDNDPLVRRHVNSLIFEVLGIELPGRWVPPFGETDDPLGETIADEDGVLREAILVPIADRLELPATRAALEEAVGQAFLRDDDPARTPAAEALCVDQLRRFMPDLRIALSRWCNRYRALLAEFEGYRRIRGVPSKAEQDAERRVMLEIERLAGPKSPEYQPLGFLGLVGFLPRYGFTGDSVLLHVPLDDEPIVQAAWVAATEYAPGNIVYARGRKLKVQRLHPAPRPENEAGPDYRDNVLRAARRCDACEVLSFDPLVKACPGCGADLVSQQVIELTGVRASGTTISSDDEFRTSEDYETVIHLAEPPEPPEITVLGGYRFERSHGREITLANRGPRPDGGGWALGFSVCTSCGFAAETTADDDDPDADSDVFEQGHAPRCPGRKDPEQVKAGLWLTARIRGDVLEMGLPPAARGDAFHSWRVTLGEALVLGIRETMQAGQRDVGWFVRPLNAEPRALTLYDTMPGGTGYLPKLTADGGEGLRLAAAGALERLEACTCQNSCHRCLRDFWNQRHHSVLDRFEVISTLRRLAEAPATEFEAAEDDRFESFLEEEFFERLSAAGLPAPTLQVVRQLGQGRITRVDAEYRAPDISVFLDGRAYHAQSLEKIADDLDRRNRLEAKGVLVLEFTWEDVMQRFDEVVVPALRSALHLENLEPSLDLQELPGLAIEHIDRSRHFARVVVNCVDWMSSESARQDSLTSSNRARLAGWRLHRSGALR